MTMQGAGALRLARMRHSANLSPPGENAIENDHGQGRRLRMPTSAKTRERFEAERAAYWTMRDELMKQYRGKWVAVVGGQVVAVADKASKVLEDAHQRTKSKVGFAVRVGYEHVVRKIRQIAGRYDDRFEPAMPLVTATVANTERERATDVEFIVDTGPDGTVLTSSVADELNLWEQTWGRAIWSPEWAAMPRSVTCMRQLLILEVMRFAYRPTAEMIWRRTSSAAT